jgi:CheY-like chemotaxis protein
MTPHPFITVLIIDDGQDDQFFMEQAFKQGSPTTQIHLADGGQQALDMLVLLRPAPDVILLDLNMPGMSGFELLTYLKQSAHHKTIPVVILTTSEAVADQELARQLGAEEFITKPTTQSDLSAIAKRIRRNWTPDTATLDQTW